MFGRNSLAEVLLKHGANPSIKDARGLKALDLAYQQGNQKAAEKLLALSQQS